MPIVDASNWIYVEPNFKFLSNFLKWDYFIKQNVAHVNKVEQSDTTEGLI